MLSLAGAQWWTGTRTSSSSDPPAGGSRSSPALWPRLPSVPAAPPFYHRVAAAALRPALARLDGRWSRLLAALAKVDVLVLDDLALRPLTTDQAADLLEVIEDRNSAAPPSSPANCPSPAGTTPWGSPPSPTPLSDRLLHNATASSSAATRSRRRHDPRSRSSPPQTVQLLQSMRARRTATRWRPSTAR